MELVQNLKQKSILYKVEKERQKNYFLNKTSSFLNKKRKPPNPLINEDNPQKDFSSYELMNLNNDYDDFYEDFVNNSMISNKTFNDLNLTRSERFSFQKVKQKIKYITKKEEGFSIIQGNQTKNYQIENNISFHSSVQQKINSNEELGLNLFSSNKDIGKKDNENPFFENANKKGDDNKINKDDSQNIKGSLFGANINEKSLFSSNIPLNDNNNKENKKEIKETDKEKKETKNLFVNIERLKSGENKETTLFGSPTKPNPEKEKEKEIEKTPETPKNKEINNSSLFGKPSTPKKENKDEEKKEKIDDKKEEIVKLFEENKTPLFGIKEKK